MVPSTFIAFRNWAICALVLLAPFCVGPVARANPAPASVIVKGATVFDNQGAAIGKLQAIDPGFVTIIMINKNKVRMPRAALQTGHNGVFVEMSASDLGVIVAQDKAETNAILAESHGNLAGTVADGLAQLQPFPPSQPLSAYDGAARPSSAASRAPSYSRATPDASLALTPSPAHQTQSSYRDHPDLEASQCLTFHGPIDTYGERVTNSCGYTVAYAFCVDGGNTALACKSGGDDISGGADTIGGGKTQDTGWVGAAGHEIHTSWHACRGKLGDVSPVMRTRNLGACMSY